MSAPRIPTVVSHDAWLAAMEPLFALLNVSPGEMVGDLNMVTTPEGHEIRFNVVARADGDDSDLPPGFVVDGHPNDEHAVWEHRVNVAVI
jgi:hypothetical protein